MTGVRSERVERVFLVTRTVAWEPWNVVRYTLANGAVMLSSYASRASDGSAYSARRRRDLVVRVSVPRCRHDVRTRTSHFIQRIIWKDSEGKTRITKLSCYRLKHPNVWQSQFYRKTSAQKYLQRSWRLYMCLMCHSGSAPATQRRLVSPTTTSLGSSPSTNAVHRSLLVIQLSFLSVYNMPAPRPQFSGCCPPSLIISYSNSCRYSNSRRHGIDFYSNPNPQGSSPNNTAQVRGPQSDSRSTSGHNSRHRQRREQRKKR